MHQSRLELSPAAQRQIKKLPKQVQKLIIKECEKLQSHPRPRNIKKMTGLDNLYRIRVGNYRIIYTIDDQALVILVVKAGNRKEIYRNLKLNS